MEAHVKDEHWNRLKCEICEKTFARNSCLKAHQKEVHPNESHKCYFCQAPFANKVDLNLHINNAHLSGHKCEYCQKSFILKSQMEAHVKDKHLKEKSVK